MAHIRNSIMEEHQASIEAYRKVHNETMRSGLRIVILQQSMEMDMWEFKENLLRDRNKWLLELTKRRRGAKNRIKRLKRIRGVKNGIKRLKRIRGVKNLIRRLKN
ncbi:hypothetical protein Tco_0033912 [Tanacetum coccineum]